MDTLRSLRVPDFIKLGEAELRLLTGWLDRLQNEILRPLPQMADDPVRAGIDDAVVQALGMDAEWGRSIGGRQPLNRQLLTARAIDMEGNSLHWGDG